MAADAVETFRRLLDDDRGAQPVAGKHPAETYWAAIRPTLRRFGITRVGDVTGLDKIGIPVVQAFRPAAKSNVVNQGKGVSMEQAALSAVMEALETWAAERLPRQRLRWATASQLLPTADINALEETIAIEDRPGWRDVHRDWIAGWDLSAERPAWLPVAMVATDYTLSSPYRAEPFRRSTTGLGAGATAGNAVRHGLAEAVERRATAEAMAMHGFFDRCRLASDTIAGATLRNLVSQVRAADLLVGFWHCPSPAGWSVVWARLLEAADGPDQLPLPADGFGASPCMHRAAEKALLEAVQTRASVIAGGREDITRRAYPRFPDRQLLDADRRLLSATTGQPFAPPRDGAIALFAGGSHDGTPRPVVAVPLFSQADPDIHVARVVLPGTPS